MASVSERTISKSVLRQLEREWSQWGRYVSQVRLSRPSLPKVSAARYRADYRALYALCRETAAKAASEEVRLYREMMQMLDPWAELAALKDVDSTLLADLERRAAELQRRIDGRSISWIRRVHIQLPAVILAVIGIGAWMSSQSDQMTNMGPLATIRQETLQLWRKTVYSFQEVNAIEVATLLVSMAVLMGMLSVMRTRKF